MKPYIVWSTVTIEKHSGRDILSGIFSFVEAGHPWRFHLVQQPDGFTAESVKAAEKEGVDGFLLTFYGDNSAFEALKQSTCPIVFTCPTIADFRTRSVPTAFVWNDNDAIGDMGANYLSGLGKFRSYGFVHSHWALGRLVSDYSKERLRGFAKTLRNGSVASTKVFMASHDQGSQEDITELAAWLGKFPKPMAVMVASDWRAMHVLAAAERAGLDVPRQIAVLGVDNDELLTTHCAPPLTSIQPGHFEIGFKAAAELERLMSARRTPVGRSMNVPPSRIVERESTRPTKPSAALVERAKKFIRQNMALGITTTDVVAHLGCSRNLADLRYKEIEGMTIRAAIEQIRLDEVRRLLKSTRRSMTAIAKQCGFRSPCHLAHLFRQRYGISMRNWRETVQAEPARP